jgi:hypothetical protein
VTRGERTHEQLRRAGAGLQRQRINPESVSQVRPDFPGAVDVRVASDCVTMPDGSISGAFGEGVASAQEPQPG